MYLFAFILLCIIGATTLYVSNKHQRLFNKPIAVKYRPLGYLCFLGAAFFATQLFSTSTSIFIWLMLTMLALMVLPFIVFLTRGRT